MEASHTEHTYVHMCISSTSVISTSDGMNNCIELASTLSWIHSNSINQNMHTEPEERLSALPCSVQQVRSGKLILEYRGSCRWVKVVNGLICGTLECYRCLVARISVEVSFNEFQSSILSFFGRTSR